MVWEMRDATKSTGFVVRPRQGPQPVTPSPFVNPKATFGYLSTLNLMEEMGREPRRPGIPYRSRWIPRDRPKGGRTVLKSGSRSRSVAFHRIPMLLAYRKNSAFRKTFP